jgi:hypothetical protein
LAGEAGFALQVVPQAAIGTGAVLSASRADGIAGKALGERGIEIEALCARPCNSYEREYCYNHIFYVFEMVFHKSIFKHFNLLSSKKLILLKLSSRGSRRQQQLHNELGVRDR